MSYPSHTPSGAAFTELLLEVFRLNGALLAAGDRLAAPEGLSSARWQVLGAIATGPATVPAIGRAMGLTRQGVQRTVDLLRREGLVEQVDNPGHRRARLVRLTSEGARRLDALSRRQAAWANAVADGIGAGELEAARRLAGRLRARLLALGMAHTDEGEAHADGPEARPPGGSRGLPG